MYLGCFDSAEYAYSKPRWNCRGNFQLRIEKRKTFLYKPFEAPSL